MITIILYCILSALSFNWIMNNIKILNKDDEITDIITNKYGCVLAIIMSVMWIISFPFIIIPIYKKGVSQ